MHRHTLQCVFLCFCVVVFVFATQLCPALSITSCVSTHVRTFAHMSYASSEMRLKYTLAETNECQRAFARGSRVARAWLEADK